MENKKAIAVFVPLLVAGMLLLFGVYQLGKSSIVKDGGNGGDTVSDPVVTAPNLTKALASEVITSLDIESVGSQEELNDRLEREGTVEKSVSEAVKNFNPDSLRPVVSDSFIKIVETNDSNSLRNYFLELNRILSEPVKPIKENDPLSVTLERALDHYKKIINNLYALPVPRAVSSFHKEEISLLSGKALVLERMRRYENDPLAAILATQADAYFDGKLAELNTQVNSFIVDNNISL